MKTITKTLAAAFIAAMLFTTAAYTQTDITSKFTDQNFHNKVCAAISKSAGCTIYDTDVNTVTYLNIGSSNITSLAGIEYFTALTGMNVWYNQLTSLDLSKNTALTSLIASGNQLTEIDVSKNTALITLWIDGNLLTEIDVSKNTALNWLNVYDNQFTEIDVSKNIALMGLWASDNQLTSLDVSKNAELDELDVSNNQLYELAAIT